jgi:hypothetical protein
MVCAIRPSARLMVGKLGAGEEAIKRWQINQTNATGDILAAQLSLTAAISEAAYTIHSYRGFL